MSETPTPNLTNPSIDPGWHQIAQEMHKYHPALQEHVARNLAQRGIAGPVMGATRLPNGELDYSRAAVVTLPAAQAGPGTVKEAVAKKDLPLQQRFQLAVDEIKSGSAPEQAYTLETAEREKPFTHYTNPGNIFQILRFGLQSANFKNRVDALRVTDPKLDDVAKQLSGLRFKTGGSYQGVDSISLGLYSSDTVRNQDLVLLVDPDTTVFGLDPSHRTASGYGHGIEPTEIDGGFDIRNPTAYQNEVVAANIVPPSEIKGVIINDRASILSGLRNLTREHVALYQQTKNTDPQATKESLFANSRLIASLSGEPDAEAKIEALESHIDTMPTVDIIQSLNVLQRDLLKGFVGRDRQLNESTVREAIQSKFGIRLLTNNQFALT